MQTRRLSTILTSAYLSAMLATSVAPIRSDATLAATIDPMAAQKALQNAVSGLNASGWTAAATLEAPPAAQAAPAVAPANNTAPKSDPVMTEELLARLIKLDRADHGTSIIDRRICKAFNLGDGTVDVPMKVLEGDLTDAGHYFALPLDTKSKDILILVQRNKIIEGYLTDNTGKLRAAVVLDDQTLIHITNEKAAEKFKAEMTQYAKEAADLPPTGAAVAGNS